MVFIGIKPSYVNNRRDFDFCISPSRIVLPPGQLLSARGPSEVNRPSWSGIDRRVCCWGSCGHWENMRTPHRKAGEIAHLSTVHSGEDLPPRVNSAPCGNRTHDLLALRRQGKQCKQLSHRAPYDDGQMINRNVINHVTKERLG